MKKTKTTFIFLMMLLSYQYHHAIYAQNVVTVDQKVKERHKEAYRHFQNQNFRFIDANEHIQGYFILNPLEQELLSLVQSNYTLFFELLKSHLGLVQGDEGARYIVSSHRTLEGQFLYPNHFSKRMQILLEDEVVRNGDKIKSDVVALGYSTAQCDFVSIYVDNLDFVRNHYHDNQKQFDLHTRARQFDRQYFEPELNSVIRLLHGSFFEPKSFGGDYSITSGFGHNTDGLGEFFQRTGSFTLELKLFWYANFFGVRIGFYGNRMKKPDFIFENDILNNVHKLQVFHYDFFLGRKLDLTRRISIVPNLGYSLTSTFFIKDPSFIIENPDFVPVEDGRHLQDLIFFGFDMNYHFVKRNIQKTQTSKFKRRLGYSSPYFVAGILFYPLDLKGYDPILRGNTFSFQFGLGVHFRPMKKGLLGCI